MQYNLHNPHISGVDPTNEDELYLEYLYNTNQPKIQQMLAYEGFIFTNDAEAIWCLKQAVADLDFQENIRLLDPQLEAQAHVYNKNMGAPNNGTQTMPAQMWLNGQHHAANATHLNMPHKSASECAKDDLICLIRETITPRVNLLFLALVVAGAFIIYHLFKTNKTA